MPKHVASTVIARENGHCVVCGLGLTVGHLHHRKPRGMGGSKLLNTVPNLLYLHPNCHLIHVEQERKVAVANGWIVQGNADPADVPVLYMLNGKVLLGDDGTITPVEEGKETD